MINGSEILFLCLKPSVAIVIRFSWIRLFVTIRCRPQALVKYCNNSHFAIERYGQVLGHEIRKRTLFSEQCGSEDSIPGDH